jgi:hypothetical protein
MKRVIYIIMFTIVGLLSCTKEKSYLYQVNNVNVTQPGGNKQNVKSTEEFISIAYSDLFGTTISQQELINLTQAYNSFGDLKLIEDMIIRNFLNTNGIVIPSGATMRSDINGFVSSSYQKFLNRTPNAYEKWFVSNVIQSDTSISPVLVYYSFMTSNEYMYY